LDPFLKQKKEMAARLAAIAYELDGLRDRIRAYELALQYRIAMGDAAAIIANLRTELDNMHARDGALAAESDALFRDLPMPELLTVYRETGGFYPILNGLRRWRLEPIWQTIAVNFDDHNNDPTIADLKKLKADVDQWLVTVQGGGFDYLQQLFPTAQMTGYGQTLDGMLRHKIEERTLALMMGGHERLGTQNIRNLDMNLWREINEMAMN
jgi:hypothetical protein